MEQAPEGHPEGTGKAVICDVCRQRVGVVDGKVATHQGGGPGSGTCAGSGRNAEN
jgi:hypothetical protein